ncbi:MAG TPA: dihydrofolate reductase family protein [Gaiellaceae bacterium]|nr:dihydrofolate reductase family protein [Gaiellaceae bacterium]
MNRRIVVSEFVTLDGVMEDPGGAEREANGFGGWAFRFDRGDAGDRFKLEELTAADALLLGRVTYEGFAAAWPSMTDEQGFAEKMNSMPKYVVSSTLSEPTWANTTVIGLEDVDGLEGNVLVAGSQQLVQTLLERRLVDELRLVLYPTAVGRGKRMFDVPADFSLVSAQPSAQVVLLTYARA